MSFSPKTVERSFEYEGATFTVVFDWETFAAFEEATGLSVLDVMPDGAKKPMISRLARLMHHALMRNHPDLTLNHAGQMLSDPEVNALFMEGMGSSMPHGDDTEAGEDGDTPPANPPKRARGKGSVGKTGLSRGSKRG